MGHTGTHRDRELSHDFKATQSRISSMGQWDTTLLIDIQ